MENWLMFFELALDLTSIIMLALLLSVVHTSLKWLPSRRFMALFLALFLAVHSVTFMLAIFEHTFFYRLYVLVLPSILLVGPIMTRFTQSTLSMEPLTLVNTHTGLLFLTGLCLVSPYLFFPMATIQLPQNEQPWMLVFGVWAFVSLFVITSSFHFVVMLKKLFTGQLYSSAYSDNTYNWLKGVWFSITFIWLCLLFNMISGVIEIPWSKLHLSLAQVDTFISFVVIVVLCSLTLVTVKYCKMPPEQSVVDVTRLLSKYEKSGLTQTHAQSILDAIDTVMSADKVFLDSTLTIEKLAKQINTASPYLSQAINQYRSMNFYDLVASYRIEYAKTMLAQSTDMNIMDVALASGFNAKSTFNHAFKKITGMTPSQYKKLH